MVVKPGKTGLGGPDDFEVVSGSHDDGERWAGDKILRVMQAEGILDAVVIVSRWYGGNLLGPARFTHIEACAGEVCRQFKQAEQLEESISLLSSLDDILADLREQLAVYTDAESSAPKTERPKPKYNAQNLDLAKAKRLIVARESSIKSVKALLAKKKDGVTASPPKD